MITRNRKEGTSLKLSGSGIALAILMLTLILIQVMPVVAFTATTYDTWESSGLRNNDVNTVPLSPYFSNDSTLFAGTVDKGIYRSTDKGKTWQQSNGANPYDIDPLHRCIRSIALSPGFTSDNTLFVGTNGGVYVSTDVGNQWALLNTGLQYTDIRSLAISKGFTTDHTLFAATNGGVYKLIYSSSGDNTWSSLNSDLTYFDVRTLAISPNFATDHTIFAGTNGGGVYKIIDGSTNWVPVNTGIPDNASISDSAISPNYGTGTDRTIFVSINGVGVYKSSDGGTNWSPANNGLTNLNIVALAISSNFPAKGNTIFAGTGGNGIFRSTDSGETWKEINNGLSHRLILDIDLSSTYYLDQTAYAGTDGGGVYKCIFSDSIPPVTTVQVEPSPADGNNGWFLTKPTITLKLYSNEPGVTYYQWDSTSDSGWIPYSALEGIPILQGSHKLYYYSVDTAGNKEPLGDHDPLPIMFDNIPPDNPTSAVSISHELNKPINDATIDINFPIPPESGCANDGPDGSGIAGYSVGWTQSQGIEPSSLEYTTNNSVTSLTPADGGWYFYIKTKDMAGNWAASGAYFGPYVVETTPPTTTMTTNPSDISGWLNRVPTITLIAEASAKTYYCWDNPTLPTTDQLDPRWIDYSTSNPSETFPVEGIHTLRFFSIDAANNKEIPTNAEFKVDLTPPTPAPAITLPAEIDNNTNTVFNWSPSGDTNSGLKDYEFHILSPDNIDQKISQTSISYTARLQAGENYKCWVIATDNVGNIARSDDVYFDVKDVIAPTTSISPTYVSTWYGDIPTITLDAHEPPVTITYFSWDSIPPADPSPSDPGGWKVYPTDTPSDVYSSVPLTDGSHTLYYFSVDAAGNRESTHNQVFKVDLTPPTSPEPNPPSIVSDNRSTSIDFSWDPSHADPSGLKTYQLYILGSSGAEVLRKSIDPIANPTSLTLVLTRPLDSGAYQWYVSAEDNAGHPPVSSSTRGSLTVNDVIPPTTTIAPSGTSKWFNSLPPITLTTEASARTYFYWDSKPADLSDLYSYPANNPSTTFPGEGIHTIYFFSIDAAGNIETVDADNEKVFKVDSTEPEQFNLISPDGEQVYNDNPQTFTWESSRDTLSGILKYQLNLRNLSTNEVVTVDNVGPTTYPGEVSHILTPSFLQKLKLGEYAWYVVAIDNAGNPTITNQFTFTLLDGIPPTTSITPTPSGWIGYNPTKTSPKIVLSANEYVTFHYSWDGVNWSESGSGLRSFTLPELTDAQIEGDHTLYFYSVDTAGNPETQKPKTQRYMVDLTPPGLITNILPASTDNNSDTRFTWEGGEDIYSGVVKGKLYITETGSSSTSVYNINDPNSRSYLLTARLKPGSYTYYIEVEDQVGHSNRSDSMPLTVSDVIAPTTHVKSVNPAPNAAGWIADMPTVTLEADEPSTIYYRWGDTGDWSIPQNNPVTFTAAGISGVCTLNFYAVDLAENIETPRPKTQTFNIDMKAPSSTIDNPTNEDMPLTTGTCSIMGTAVDPPSSDSSPGSGIAKVEISVQDGGWQTVNWETVNGITSWSYSLDMPEDGDYKIEVMATDVAGNAQIEPASMIVTKVSPTQQEPIETSISIDQEVGEKGWYTTIPSITLSRNLPGTTYYQWDSLSDDCWEGYLESFYALEGEHTLYFYSEDLDHNKEPVNDPYVFKVDAHAPSQPTDVTAVALCESRIELKWKASEDNIGVTDYKIERSLDGNTWLPAGTTSADTEFTDTELSVGQTYYYRVIACDAAGNESEVSKTAQATTFQSSAPTNPGTGEPVTVKVGDIAELSFSSVSEPGVTSATLITDPPYGISNPNLRFRGYHVDLCTTAVYSAPITITIFYDPNLVKGNEKNLRLMHYDGKHWDDITTKVVTSADVTAGLAEKPYIQGQTSSLSPFAVTENVSSSSSPGGGGSSSVPTSSIWGLILMGVFAIGMLRKSLKKKTPSF